MKRQRSQIENETDLHGTFLADRVLLFLFSLCALYHLFCSFFFGFVGWVAFFPYLTWSPCFSDFLSSDVGVNVTVSAAVAARTHYGYGHLTRRVAAVPPEAASKVSSPFPYHLLYHKAPGKGGHAASESSSSSGCMENTSYAAAGTRAAMEVSDRSLNRCYNISPLQLTCTERLLDEEQLGDRGAAAAGTQHPSSSSFDVETPGPEPKRIKQMTMPSHAPAPLPPPPRLAPAVSAPGAASAGAPNTVQESMMLPAFPPFFWTGCILSLSFIVILFCFVFSDDMDAMDASSSTADLSTPGPFSSSSFAFSLSQLQHPQLPHSSLPVYSSSTLSFFSSFSHFPPGLLSSSWLLGNSLPLSSSSPSSDSASSSLVVSTPSLFISSLPELRVPDVPDDTVRWMQERERSYQPRPSYLSHQPHIDAGMRAVLIDWLMEVSRANHSEFITSDVSVSCFGCSLVFSPYTLLFPFSLYSRSSFFRLVRSSLWVARLCTWPSTIWIAFSPRGGDLQRALCSCLGSPPSSSLPKLK